MSGVSWDERKPGDWLASNGRWYPKSSYPNGWDTLALPPAPGHGDAGSILRRVTAVVSSANDAIPRTSTPPPSQSSPQSSARRPTSAGGQVSSAPRTPSPPPSPPAPLPGFSVTRSGRAVADATVTQQRTHTPRVAAGSPPPPALPNKSEVFSSTPPPPGRIRDDAPRPAPPTRTPSTAVTPAPPPTKTDIEVVAGDLGKVFGSAKRRIEKALNDAAESQ